MTSKGKSLIGGNPWHDKSHHSQANPYKYFFWELSSLANFDIKSVECPIKFFNVNLNPLAVPVYRFEHHIQVNPKQFQQTHTSIRPAVLSMLFTILNFCCPQ